MKITEILVESQQLDEGPLLNKIGSAIGKGAGALAKGVGAVAGGVAGAGTALKKGWDAGKAAVARAGDDEPETASPAAGAPAATAQAAPAAAPVGGPTAHPGAGAVNKAGPAGSAPAKPLQGQAKAAADKTAAATAGQDPSAAGQTMYAQVKANIDKLDKKGKQRILQLLQKSMAAPAVEKPAAGGGAMGAMASQLGAAGGKPANTMANAPVSATNTAKPGNPNAAAPEAPAAAPEAPAAAPAAKAATPKSKPAAKPAAAPAAAPTAEPEAPAAAPAAASGEKTIANPVATVGTKRATNIGEPTFDKTTGKALPGQALNAVRKKAEYGSNALGAVRKKMKAKAPDQATIDAERDKIMGVTSDSIVRRQPALAESFSLFRKRA